MSKHLAQSFTTQLLQSAGIEVGGHQPWDIRIQHPGFYERTLREGSLGFGEAYMDGWWECDQIDQLIYRLLRADLTAKIKLNMNLLLKRIWLKIINLQTRRRSLVVGEKHYDLGVPLFEAMLDRSLNYSCGYWRRATNLDQAQQDKMEMICQKLMLKPGMRLLDVGCGFGSLAQYAARHFGVTVVGITISKQQAEYAKKACEGLSIEIRFQDYRDVNETFDRIVSVGMFEHVGAMNYIDYFNMVKRSLKPEGLFLLHTIGGNVSTVLADEWIVKYIFPNGMLPSISQIGEATEGKLVMEDWHNFGADYDKTLMSWHDHFTRHWETLKQLYDARFYRMWRYYLLTCAGAFRARDIQLWQVVFSKSGVVGGYVAPRLT
jgi:cyclopropane-fatty-acyl-phospholipid synthase